jgi:purine-nucleoside phosphorylase
MLDKKSSVSTPHNSAHRGDIAETVLLPGDPLRARFVAESFLENAVQYNGVRGMLGYTGSYRGKKVSVQGTGMGGPSIGIYAHELIHNYGVKRLIRIGSAGGLQDNLAIGDILLACSASFDSAIGEHFIEKGTIAPAADFTLLIAAEAAARKLSLPVKGGPVLSSDFFYHPKGLAYLKSWKRAGIVAVEMEAASLYLNAMYGGVQALCILTVSDLPFQGESASTEMREKGLGRMVELALELV